MVLAGFTGTSNCKESGAPPYLTQLHMATLALPIRTCYLKCSQDLIGLSFRSVTTVEPRVI